MAITKKNTCSIQTVVNQLEGLFDSFNDEFFNNELQKPVITVNPDNTKGGITMDVREKLVEILADAGMGKTERNFLADYLISNGVTVQECKLGDKIYQTDGVRIYESIVGEITLTAKHTIFVTENIVFDERAIGNSVFLSYAEAQAQSKVGR